MQVTRALLFILLVPGSALAEAPAPSEAACLAAHRETQELQLDKKLLAAEAAAVTCARPQCPEEVRTMCTDFLVRIRASQPTVVFELRGDGGSVFEKGSLTIDDDTTSRSLDGAAIPLDPGEHSIVYAAEGQPASRLTILVRQGEKDRKIALPVAEPGGASFSPWAHVLGAAGVSSLLAFAGLGIATSLQADDLEAECGHRCEAERPEDVDAVVAQALAADVCLGVGLGLLAAAGLTMDLTWSPAKSAAQTRAFTLEVGPARVGLGLRF